MSLARSRSHLRLVLGALLLCTSCVWQVSRQRSEDPWKSFESEVKTWGPVSIVELGGADWLFRPYTRIHPHVDSKNEICVAHRIPGQAGSYCFIAGDWAVETRTQSSQGHSVIVGVTVLESDTVVISLETGGTIEVKPDQVFANRKTFFRRVSGTPNRMNGIAAFDKGGTKLGNEHRNIGTSECPWFGPWDGVLDQTYAQPRPDCL